jgi:hypothetical protein
MLVTVDILQGLQVVSFQGASEWALDSLVTTEVVWLPKEDQLRQTLEAALIGAGRPEMRLTMGVTKHRLDFMFRERMISLEGQDVSELYADGLLQVLKSSHSLSEGQG